MSMKRRIVVFVAYAGFASRFFRMIAQGAANVLYDDQWDFNDRHLHGHGIYAACTLMTSRRTGQQPNIGQQRQT